jgi:phosphoadenosine phosphosulfate reductase
VSAQLLRRPASELRALAESGAAAMGIEASAAEVIGWVAEHFDVEQAAVASSMANAVLPHLVARQLPGVDVLFLDTGYHFAETLGTRADVARRLNVNVVDLQPEQSVAEQDAAHGKDLFARNPSLCCQLRKVEPLARALADYEVWFTGIRRDEGPTRSNAPLISWDERHGLVKVNPLAAWSFDELLEYAGANDVPINMLLANGYPSIGCWPCTRPVADGEDPRSGRWAGLSKTECGIHT